MLNHCALVAFSVHLEHKGAPLNFPLDVVEMAKVTRAYLGAWPSLMDSP